MSDAPKVVFHPTKPYEPPSRFWRGAHRQLLMAEWIKNKRTPALPWRSEKLSLGEGQGFVRMFRLMPATPIKGVLVAFHGLGGTADGPNLRRFARTAAYRGYVVVSVEMLGAGGAGPIPRLYTAADTGVFDAAAAIPGLRLPGLPLLFCGVSLGGGMLLRWLGLRGDDAPIDGVLTLSPIGHLPSSAEALARFGNRFYDRRFASLYASRLGAVVGDSRAPFDARRHKTMRALDEDFASFWAEHPDAASYYEFASAHRTAGRIARPTLIIASADDPFAPPGPLTSHYGGLPNVDLRMSRFGSHVAFLDRRNGGLEPVFPELLLDPLER